MMALLRFILTSWILTTMVTNVRCQDDTSTIGTTLPPPEMCCTFNDDQLCGWSPERHSLGWKWSEFKRPNQPIINPGSPYLYAEDQSALAISPNITAVVTGTSFSVNYYFNTDDDVFTNVMNFSFVDLSGSVTTLFSTSSPTEEQWILVSLSCDESCCSDGIEPCEGSFVVDTYAEPFTHLLAGIDSFSVDDNIC